MKKLWGGRFSKPVSPEADIFMASITYDKRLAPYDIKGSIAHVKTLAKAKVLTLVESEKIQKGLLGILKEIETGKFKFHTQDEDIHLAIEKRLTQKIGSLGAKLHTARSRNDQVSLDIRLFLKDKNESVIEKIGQLQQAVLNLAEQNFGVILPGMTHLQPAQPVLFSHHLLAYFEMFQRDKERFMDAEKRIDVMPLGSGALAGVGFPVDRTYTAKVLGFSKITANSMDAVSDRDFIVEFLADSSLLLMHTSRICQEFTLWSSPIFSFVKIDEAFTTGSSMLPQKRNPDVAELLRAKTGRVYGHLINLLSVLKALPLSYNRDLQEDKEPLFDTVDLLENGLPLLAKMVATIKVDAVRMREATEQGFVLAIDVADYLVKKGVPFRKAHELTGSIVRECENRKCVFSEIPLEEWKKFSPLFEKDIMDKVQVSDSVKAKLSFGGTGPNMVGQALKNAKKLLQKR